MNIKVTAGLTATVDAQLRVGATLQSVGVTASVPVVDSAPSHFTTVLRTNDIQKMPLPGRDIQALMQLVPE